MADLSMPVRRSTTEPSNLAVAIRIAEHTLDSDNPTAIREALRILLRATLGQHNSRPTTTRTHRSQADEFLRRATGGQA